MADSFPSISILIPDLVDGHEPAWAKLFDRFRVGLTSKARRLCGGMNASFKLSPDDLVQETILKAWNSRSTFRGETTAQFSLWILTIMRNTFRDHLSSGEKEFPLASWYDFEVEDETPSAKFFSGEREAALHACLAELDCKQQEVVTMRHFEGLKFKEIAERCNANINTVASHYRRAIRNLSEMMRARDHGQLTLVQPAMNGGLDY